MKPLMGFDFEDGEYIPPCVWFDVCDERYQCECHQTSKHGGELFVWDHDTHDELIMHAHVFLHPDGEDVYDVITWKDSCLEAIDSLTQQGENNGSEQEVDASDA